ncbi:unnamed protein product, partial [Ectocarpus sp. 13 AM-2016]
GDGDEDGVGGGERNRDEKPGKREARIDKIAEESLREYLGDSDAENDSSAHEENDYAFSTSDCDEDAPQLEHEEDFYNNAEYIPGC